MFETSLIRWAALGAVVVGVAGCEQAAVRAEAGPDVAEGPVPARPLAGADEPGGAAAAEPAPALKPAPRAEEPAFIRGIYLNTYAAGSRKRLGQLLEIADRTEVNAFVVDVKDERGVHYRTGHPLAAELAQPGEVTLRDLAAFVDTLHAHGVYAIARVVVFKDPILSKAKPEWSIRQPGGGLWKDKKGNTWVSPWNRDVWEYNIRIAEEAARAGFDAVQFDYVRFPEAYRSLPDQIHPEASGQRTDAIVAFLEQARPRVHAAGAVLTADLFGLSTVDPGDVGIGQQWERILAVADHVLPMVYPSHYFPTHLRGIRRPNQQPYETVHASVGIGVVRRDALRDAGVATPARVVPWLQAFDAPWVDKTAYGADAARAQIRAVYDTGLEDWIFWHPGSKYEQIAAAFEPEPAPRAATLRSTPDMTATLGQIEPALADVRARTAAGTATAAH